MRHTISKRTGSKSLHERDIRQLIRGVLEKARHCPLKVESRHTRNHIGVLRIRNNHPTWCGPVAVAFLTGCTTNDAAQLYTNVRNRNVGPLKKFGWMKKSSLSLSGVYPGETWEVLNLLGYDMELIEKASGVTVETLADRRFSLSGGYRPDDKLLVMLPSHYVVAHHFLVSDNHVQHVPGRQHPYGDKKVDEAWRIFEKPYGGELTMVA